MCTAVGPTTPEEEESRLELRGRAESQGLTGLKQQVGFRPASPRSVEPSAAPAHGPADVC